MKKLMQLCLVGIIGISLIIPGISNAAVKSVNRIEGADRYETAVKISNTLYFAHEEAIIASGENYPDALVGGTLATQISAPVFLTRKDSIPMQTQKEISKLGIKKIYLIGGEAVISKKVENELAKNYKVTRLAGKNRQETAAAINKERQKRAGYDGEIGDWRMYSVVSPSSYADALSASPFVGQLEIHNQTIDPINLSGGFLLMPLWKGTIDYGFYMMGGTSALPYNPVEDYGAFFGTRIAGKNRYGTAVEIANLYKTRLNKDLKEVYIASGRNYPDALASAPVVGNTDSVLLLTDPDSLSIETKQFIQSKGIETVYVLGGPKAISENVIKEIKAIK